MVDEKNTPEEDPQSYNDVEAELDGYSKQFREINDQRAEDRLEMEREVEENRTEGLENFTDTQADDWFDSIEIDVKDEDKYDPDSDQDS